MQCFLHCFVFQGGFLLLLLPLAWWYLLRPSMLGQPRQS